MTLPLTAAQLDRAAGVLLGMACGDGAATGADVRTIAARDQIAARWAAWGEKAKDVGDQTRAVLTDATRAARSNHKEPTAVDLALVAAAHEVQTGPFFGNGSLMRTAPIALAYLHVPDALVLAAEEISALTHHDHPARGRGARITGRTSIDALADIVAVLPQADPNGGLRAALEQLG